jgi:hypothetical protein
LARKLHFDDAGHQVDTHRIPEPGRTWWLSVVPESPGLIKFVVVQNRAARLHKEADSLALPVGPVDSKSEPDTEDANE